MPTPCNGSFAPTKRSRPTSSLPRTTCSTRYRALSPALHVWFFVIAHPRPWQWNEEVQEGVGLELGDGRSSLLRSRAKFCSEVLPALLAQQQRNNQSYLIPPPPRHTTGECVHTSGVRVCAPLRRQQGDPRLHSLLLFDLPPPHPTQPHGSTFVDHRTRRSRKSSWSASNRAYASS
jgi:hypothetical protein